MITTLKIGTKEFFRQFDDLIKQGTEKLDKEFIEPKILETEINDWGKTVKNFLVVNIPHLPEKLTSDFDSDYMDGFLTHGFYVDDFKKNPSHHIDHLKTYLERKIKSIQMTYDYLSVSDVLNEKSQPDLNTINEKIFFALEKLYKLDNDNFYSISIIFDLNNIEYREDETNEIATDLKKRGYGNKNTEWKANDFLKITVKGATYVERKRKAIKTKSKSNREKDLNSKIDQVLSELKKLDEIRFGQEIIFSEIEELRSDSKKLSKKSWGQLVKGKVFDLALKELISKKTAKFIYESLVDDKFNLLS